MGIYTPQFAWTAGVQYDTDVIIIGANYLYAQDAGSVIAPGARRQNLWSAGAAWRVAPGLKLAVEYVRNAFDNEAGSGQANQNADLVLFKANLKF